MDSIFSNILAALRKGDVGCLCTIVQRKGSVPRKEGAHLFLSRKGKVYGTIGGGGLEAEVLKRGSKLIGTNRGSLQSFTLVEGDEPSDMVCGGNVSVLLEPISPTDEKIIGRIVTSLEDQRAVCFLRLLKKKEHDEVVAGPKGVGFQDGTCFFLETLPPSLDRGLRAWSHVILHEDSASIRILTEETLPSLSSTAWDTAILEALHVLPRLVIFGGGHLSKALCSIATLCGFQVDVIDDREEFANPQRFPEARRAFHLPGYQKITEVVSFDSHTFVVIATRGHRFDETVLSQIIHLSLPYIGMVGSRQKNAIVFDRLKERGIPASALQRVHAPIGLPIRSETPEEIAVSILAEIIQVRRRAPKEAKEDL